MYDPLCLSPFVLASHRLHFNPIRQEGCDTGITSVAEALTHSKRRLIWRHSICYGTLAASSCSTTRMLARGIQRINRQPPNPQMVSQQMACDGDCDSAFMRMKESLLRVGQDKKTEKNDIPQAGPR